MRRDPAQIGYFSNQPRSACAATLPSCNVAQPARRLVVCLIIETGAIEILPIHLLAMGHCRNTSGPRPPKRSSVFQYPRYTTRSPIPGQLLSSWRKFLDIFQRDNRRAQRVVLRIQPLHLRQVELE